MEEGGSTFAIHRDYVNMQYGCTQGSYTDITIMRNTTQIFIDLVTAQHQHLSLTEIEIFEGTSLPWER